MDARRTAKQRSCSLWLRIIQDGKTTWYRLRTSRGGAGRVQRVLSKMDSSLQFTLAEYTVTEPFQGRCVCTCPDWTNNRLDCKHIRALRANDYIAGLPATDS